MNVKTVAQVFLSLFVVLIIFSFFYFFFYQEKNIEVQVEKNTTLNTKNLNIKSKEKDNVDEIIENINYVSVDQLGNKYLISADSGKFNLKNQNIMLLENVFCKILLVDRSPILIYSNFAQYDTINYDTKFYDKVDVKFEENEITSNNLDLFFKDNYGNMYNNIYFFNNFSEMKADKITFDLLNGNVNINMIDDSKKIKILKK